MAIDEQETVRSAPADAKALSQEGRSGALIADPHGQAPQPVQPSARPADWLKIGFYFALGAVLLLVVAMIVHRLLAATLSVILPFVLGGALALLLDPLVERIQRTSRMPRAAAAIIVFMLLLLIIGGSISLLVPALIAQITNLANNGPEYIQRVGGVVNSFLLRHKHIGSYQMPASFSAIESSISGRATGLLQQSSGKITGFLIGSATTLIQLVLALIVTLFLLLDLKRLRARLLFLMPERWRGPAKLMSSDVGGVFSDYVRGLLIVCALFGVGTTILLYGLSLAHHELSKYALLVGVVAGVLYAVPYVGSLTTAMLIFIVGFAAGGVGFGGIAVAASLVLNQIFDNIVTPKVVGGGVGLHPVVALFALVLGGELFGIWGMLLSVPVAASIQVILFRLYPKTTAPTPPELLAAEGVAPQEGESAKVVAGQNSATVKRQKREKRN